MFGEVTRPCGVNISRSSSDRGQPGANEHSYRIIQTAGPLRLRCGLMILGATMRCGLEHGNQERSNRGCLLLTGGPVDPPSCNYLVRRSAAIPSRQPEPATCNCGESTLTPDVYNSQSFGSSNTEGVTV